MVPLTEASVARCAAGDEIMCFDVYLSKDKSFYCPCVRKTQQNSTPVRLARLSIQRISYERTTNRQLTPSDPRFRDRKSGTNPASKLILPLEASVLCLLRLDFPIFVVIMAAATFEPDAHHHRYGACTTMSDSVTTWCCSTQRWFGIYCLLCRTVADPRTHDAIE